MAERNERTARWERRLGISTTAGDYEKEDAHHSRYEPTDYAVLERLAFEGYISKENILADYGCGKGRVGFFLNQVLGCRTIGIEYDKTLYEQALENLTHCALRGARNGEISFVWENAENWNADAADRYYFFNPFSVNIFRAVLKRIFESYYNRPREIYLFVYYPLDEYISCLSQEDRLYCVGVIDCRDLFAGDDPREQILVYSLGHELRWNEFYELAHL